LAYLYVGKSSFGRIPLQQDHHFFKLKPIWKIDQAFKEQLKEENQQFPLVLEGDESESGNHDATDNKA
jgi:hypothetical protein